MDLSIIVPVYNVEKYLRECLDSLIDQDIENYEVIIVNDGSKDLSQPIIDEYVAKHKIFHSLIKTNGGLGDARNYGLRYAKGEYIAFLDSDDKVEKDAYKKLLDKAKEDNSDIVLADLEYFWKEGKTIVKEGLSKIGKSDNAKAFLSPLFAWNKIYKRDFFLALDVLYPKGLWYEDIPVTLMAFAKAKKISYLNEALFKYRQREESIMASSYDERMYHIFDSFNLVLDNFKKRDLFNKYYDELEYLFVEHFLVYGAFRFLRCPKPYYKDLMKKAFKYVKDNFPKYKKNIYIKDVFSKNQIIFLKTNNTLTMSFWHLYLRRKNA